MPIDASSSLLILLPEVLHVKEGVTILVLHTLVAR
jgi:hypothetical protein